MSSYEKIYFSHIYFYYCKIKNNNIIFKLKSLYCSNSIVRNEILNLYHYDIKYTNK